MPRAWIEKWASGGLDELLSDFGTPPRDMLHRLVALQEEVDWAVYRLFGLLDEKATARELAAVSNLCPSDFSIHARYDHPSPAELAPGRRPFEQLLDPNTTQWFTRNQYREPVPPEDYGPSLGNLLRVRMEVIAAVREIQIIEKSEYKHRWTVRDVDSEAMAAATDWALAAIETVMHEVVPSKASAITLRWLGMGGKRASTMVQRYVEGDAGTWVRGKLVDDAVPFLAAHRHTDSGLEKYVEWERTWELQRSEDAGEQVSDIPVPPKYDKEDYRDNAYWTLRGKLDVPKERFISYPGCESDEDREPVYGWAGWNHLQRAQALAQLYNSRREEGWGKERLQPMLAGLLALMPWLLQWHNDPSEELGGQRPGEQFSLFLEGQCAELGFTHEDLRAWRPAAKRGKGKKAEA